MISIKSNTGLQTNTPDPLGYINRKRILVFIIKFKGIYILRFSWLDFQRGNFLVLTLQYVFEVFICVNILKISLL